MRLNPLCYTTDSHHEAVFFSFEVGLQKYVEYERIVYNFKRANFSEISEFLNSIDWDSELDHNRIDICVSNLYDKLNAAIEENVPIMKLTAAHFPPWYTADLKQLTLYKKKMHATLMDLSNPNRHLDWVEFSRIRAKRIRDSRTCFREYTTRMETRTRGDSKECWSYVKSLEKPSDLPNEMYFKEKKGNDYI